MDKPTYKVIKDNYILRFTKEIKGLILKVSHKKASESKYFSIVPPGNVYLYLKEKWELLDTSTLQHERTAENYIERSSYDLIKTILLFPLAEILTLSYDEIFFLQALAYDMFTENKSWLPVGNEYQLKDSKLISSIDGCTYTYDMPTALGISLHEFLNKENTYVKKDKKRFLDKIPLKIKGNKLRHIEERNLKIPLTKYTASAEKDYQHLPEITEKDYMEVSTEEVDSEEELEKTITLTDSHESDFNTMDITLTEEED